MRCILFTVLGCVLTISGAFADEPYSIMGVVAHDQEVNNNGWAVHLDGLRKDGMVEDPDMPNLWILNKHIPILIGHVLDEEHIVGFVEALWITEGMLIFVGELKFSDKSKHWKALVVDGKITKTSLGIASTKGSRHNHGGEERCYGDWILREISIVIKGADPKAQVLSVQKL